MLGICSELNMNLYTYEIKLCKFSIHDFFQILDTDLIHKQSVLGLRKHNDCSWLRLSIRYAISNIFHRVQNLNKTGLGKRSQMSTDKHKDTHIQRQYSVILDKIIKLFQLCLTKKQNGRSGLSHTKINTRFILLTHSW